VSFVFEAKMPYTAVDLPKWVKLDYLTTATEPEIEAMVNSANTNLPAFIARMKKLDLYKKADDKARREIEEADRRRRERKLADAIEASEIAEAEERRQRNAREIGVQLVGSRHLDANSREANRQVDRRAAQQQADQHVVRIHHMPPGSLGGHVIVHHHGGGGAPIAVGINGVPRAVFGPPMINPFPFAMPGFGARHF
jgi:hypothetical protein